jgi:hypothetical protein
MTEGYKKLNDHLVELQSQFNKVVDPYNDVRKSMAKNKEGYQTLAKLYNDRNKKIEGYKKQLHQRGEIKMQI